MYTLRQPVAVLMMITRGNFDFLNQARIVIAVMITLWIFFECYYGTVDTFSPIDDVIIIYLFMLRALEVKGRAVAITKFLIRSI